MAATGEKLAIPTDPSERSGRVNSAARRPTSPLAEFRVALGLYVLWSAIAWLSVITERTTLAQQATGVLFIGIVATNALFLLISYSDRSERPPDVTITLSQSVLGITWATLFVFMSTGSGELVLGMYISTILFAVPRINLAAASQLTAFATASYGIVVLFKALLTGSQPPLWPEFITVLTFSGVMASVLLYRKHLDNGSSPAEGSTPARKNHDVGQSDYRFTLDTLTREKGRTDRSNHPFSICVFDIDHFEQLVDAHDRDTSDRIRERVWKRIRGELRAMDGIRSGTNPLSLDRLDDARYIVILPTTNHAGATRCAERVRAAVTKYPIEGQHAVTVSAGVVEYRRGESVSTLLDRAGGTLSRAIAAGGDRIVGFDAGEAPCADIIPLRHAET